MPSAARSLTPRAGAVAALSLAAALSASACGVPSPSTPSPSGTPAGTSTEPGDAASTTALRRSGGLAGFDDRLVVAPDGRVTGATRTASVECAVAAQTVETLATAAAPTVAPAAGADRMTVTLVRGDGTVDLGEAQGGDPLSTTARALLDDVQLPPDQRTVCR
ncbi:MAG TPA: hypothetical protein VFU85_03995 [Nocardioides sp.]|nr:hypothetical protein [Nocardioides sp.]